MLRKQQNTRKVEAYIFLLLTNLVKEIHVLILCLTLPLFERQYIILLLLKTLRDKILYADVRQSIRTHFSHDVSRQGG